MLTLFVRLKSLLKRQSGQGMVEYAMIIGLVAVGVLALLTLVGDTLEDFFQEIVNTIQNF